MKRNLTAIAFLPFFFLFLSCKPAADGALDLRNNAQKKAYLESIYAADQEARQHDRTAELLLQYGQDSEVFQNYAREQWAQDTARQVMIERYLQQYGHPRRQELGEVAAETPWLVLHHCTDTGVRNYYFPVLYRAFLAGEIDDTRLSMYLARTYDLTYHEGFVMDNPYTAQDKINALIEALGLQAQVREEAGGQSTAEGE